MEDDLFNQNFTVKIKVEKTKKCEPESQNQS